MRLIQDNQDRVPKRLGGVHQCLTEDPDEGLPLGGLEIVDAENGTHARLQEAPRQDGGRRRVRHGIPALGRTDHVIELFPEG